MEDKSNELLIRLFANNLMFYIKNSSLLNAYFGELYHKEVENSNLLISSFNIGFRNPDQTPLPNIDVFFRAPNETAFPISKRFLIQFGYHHLS